LFAFLLLLTGLAHATTPTNVVITQVYGAGGNSGAVLNADYVELFNPTQSTLTLSNYSIQYASAAGTTISTVTNLPASITLAPGQYYLVAAAAGSTGSALPAPDAPNTSLSLGASAGKVYLVNTTSKLTAACPATDPTIVDFVAFGTGTNCAYTAAAPAPSTTKADVRTNACNVTGNSSTEFTAATPAPHNSSSTFAPCTLSGNPQPIAASALATPSTIYTGNTTLLTVTVTPATLPASTGLTVSANLTAIGGTSTQPFYDDGTHGDVTAGDNVFSLSTASTATGTFTLPVTVQDAQARTATANIALVDATPPPTVSIRTIQAAKPSAYATQTVTTSGIVIGIKSNGFYIESKDADTTPTTPEGILVYTGSTVLPSYIKLGAEVQVQGTEIDAPETFTLLTANNPLPTPVKIAAAMDSPTGGIKQFAKYEGMRVAIDSVTTTSGTDASLNEATETNTSNGRFYGVVTGVPRPFREPGISIADTAYTTAIPAGVPLWDSNPELIYFDSLAFGAPAIDVTSNATLTGVSGVMDFSFGSPELLIDAATRPTVTGLMTAQPVPTKAATEFTVASFNMERFYNDIADADNPSSQAVIVTTAAYQRRLAKASLAIRNVLNFPDIVGAQEIENLNVLTDLANKISADATTAGQTDPVYKPYLFLATDGTAINTGFLVKSTTVDTLKVEQFGLTTTFTNAGGNQATLNDRTPLVLHAGIKRGGGKPDYNVTVIDVHQRSLINIDDPTSTGITVRLKHEAQSEYLASLIQSYQSLGEHVITVGDFNSFEFNDGFVDNLGVIRGNPVPSTQVVQTPVSGLANPPLVDLVTLLPAAQRQSYVESGSAQVLDHVVVTQDLVPTETRLVYAHMDSDFPLVYLNDATRPERVSDHDPAVAFFTIPALGPAVTLSTTNVNFGEQRVSTTSPAQTIVVTNSGNDTLNIAGITPTGAAFSQTNTCGTTLAAAATCNISVTFTPTTTTAATGTVTIASDASTSPTVIALTGTGGLPAVTLSASSLTFGTQLVSTASPAQTVVLTNSGTDTLHIAGLLLGSPSFRQTSTCGATLAPAATCNIVVTFNPTTPTTATGTITVTSDASTSPTVITLTGAGVAPAATLSATSLNFGNQGVNTATAQSITLTNSGNSVLNIAGTTSTGAAFRFLSTCGATLAPAATCTINVTFTPTTTTATTGTLTIASDASSSPTTITLAGSGGDFTVTPTTPSVTIAAGGTAGFPLTLTPLGGYTGTVSFTCSTLTTGETCFATPVPLAATGTTAASVVVYTTPRTLASLATHTGSVQLASLAVGGLSLLALAGSLKRKRLTNAVRLLSLCALLATLGALAGCGGSSGSTTTGTPNPAGTPAGTQTITLTATAGGVSHTANVTLIVQ
jgi:hypothetical protein